MAGAYDAPDLSELERQLAEVAPEVMRKQIWRSSGPGGVGQG